MGFCERCQTRKRVNVAKRQAYSVSVGICDACLDLRALAGEFEQWCQDGVEECHRLGYYPHIWEEIMRDMHAVAGAKYLTASSTGDVQYGFRHLVAMGRVDITVEHGMVQECFRHLFTPEELEVAEFRLDPANWDWMAKT